MNSKHTPLTFNTMSREMLEAELRRCNEVMIADGKRISILTDALKQCESAMIKARLEAGKVDDANEDRRTTGGRKLFPCNQAVVHATDDALASLREIVVRWDNDPEGRIGCGLINDAKALLQKSGIN